MTSAAPTGPVDVRDGGGLRFLPLGTDGVLVEAATPSDALALFRTLVGEPLGGVTDVVAGARTVALRYLDSLLTAETLVTVVRRMRVRHDPDRDGRLVVLPVDHDPEVLDRLARASGASPAEVLARHLETTYAVGHTGGGPGAVHLLGADEVLHAALDHPATARGHGADDDPTAPVPDEGEDAHPEDAHADDAHSEDAAPRSGGAAPRGGTLVLEHGHLAVHPGPPLPGEVVLGTTHVDLWDLDRRVPAALQPGMRVRFAAAGDERALADATERGETVGDDDPAPSPEPPATRGALHVLDPGAHAVVQDLGRPARSGLGLSRSGAMDHRALREADRLVGMSSGAAVVELAGGGFEAVAHGDHVVALAGAPVPVVVRTARGRRHEVVGEAFALDDGDVLSVGTPDSGVWTCLAVRGGLAVPTALDSASGDLRTRVGPGRLAAGDDVPVATAWAESVAHRATDVQRRVPGPGEVTVVDVVLGPRDACLTSGGLELLRDEAWRVLPDSDRTGLRLAGGAPVPVDAPEVLPCEPCVPGAVSVDVDGGLVVAMADHPVTLTRPVVAVVVADQLDRVAQVPSGARVRFRVVPGPVLDGRHVVAVDGAPDERGSEL